jgi:hypothetical protein
LKSLKKAIDLDVTHRIHAVSDPDFSSLAEEESFKALIEE